MKPGQTVSSIREIYLIDEMRHQLLIHKLYIDRVMCLDNLFLSSYPQLRHKGQRNYFQKIKSIMTMFTDSFNEMADTQFKKAAKYITSLLPSNDDRQDFLLKLKSKLSLLQDDYETKMDELLGCQDLANKEFWEVGYDFLKSMSGLRNVNLVYFDQQKTQGTEVTNRQKDRNLIFTDRIDDNPKMSPGGGLDVSTMMNELGGSKKPENYMQTFGTDQMHTDAHRKIQDLATGRSYSDRAKDKKAGDASYSNNTGSSGIPNKNLRNPVD